MTLSRRLLVALVLVAIASCALTFGIGVVLVRHRIAAQRVAVLTTTANAIALVGGPPGALGAGDHVYRMGSGRPRPVRARVAQAIVARIGGAEGTGTVSIHGRALLYAARRTAQGRVILVRSAKVAFAEWRPFIVSLALASLGGVLLALALSSLLARRLTRPIGRLAQATRRLAAGETAVAVPIEGSDELAGLGRAFNHMSVELTRAREAQRTFLESVSHELKTPLTSIRGYAEAIGEGAIEPAEAASVIGSEADRLQRLVTDLLDLARLGRADFAVERTTIDLGAVARTAVARHLPRARELGVQLEATGDGSAPAQGDAGRLLQATSNLIENALRLTPAGGTVRVATEPGRLTVTDEGPGLADGDLPHAFERFYLYERYRSERPVGTGLGLAIVEALVSAMGGQVAAEQPPGGGARFSLSLPAVPGSSAATEAGADTPAGSARAPARSGGDGAL